ncbi:MAG: YlxR family protein [Bacilli bacterium]|nr:YlxR family protein [Bacilli bacterium]
MKKESLRSDILTRERLPISCLFRLVKEDGELILAKNYEAKGRGIYLKKDEVSIQAIQTPKALKRLGAKISEKTIEEMEASL